MISVELKHKFKQIKARGYIKTLRNGPTGVGYTLETLLGIKENNIKLPDLGSVELKVKRDNQNSLISLFTFNKKVWKMKPLEAVKKYGGFDKNGRQGMYYTMSTKPNSAGLFLFIEDDNISVRHIEGTVVATWKLDEIEKRFEAKVKNLLLVKSKVEMRDGIEYFILIELNYYQEVQIKLF